MMSPGSWVSASSARNRRWPSGRAETHRPRVEVVDSELVERIEAFVLGQVERVEELVDLASQGLVAVR